MLKYEKVTEEVIEYINENKLKQGDKLPALDQLTELYDVSKTTVIKALELLERRGLIYQVQGSGIFVRQSKRKGYINLIEAEGFQKDLPDFKLESKVISFKLIKPDERVAEILNLSVADDIYYVKRLQSIEGLPLCLEESYYSKKHILYLNEEIASESIFTFITDSLNLDIGFSDSFMRIAHLNEEDSQLLDEKVNDVCLYVENLYYLHNGEVFDYSVLKYHKDQAQFFIPSNRRH